jgi:hypothetical protein
MKARVTQKLMLSPYMINVISFSTYSMGTTLIFELPLLSYCVRNTYLNVDYHRKEFIMQKPETLAGNFGRYYA